MDAKRYFSSGNQVNGTLAALLQLKKNERKMNAVEMRSLPRICGVSLDDDDN